MLLSFSSTLDLTLSLSVEAMEQCQIIVFRDKCAAMERLIVLLGKMKKIALPKHALQIRWVLNEIVSYLCKLEVYLAFILFYFISPH